MSKVKFFIDMDSTITNSVKSFCTTYNKIYQYYPEFKPADHTKLKQYNFKCICPLVYNPLEIFNHDLFFKNLEFINDNTYEVLEKLSRKYQLIIVTIGKSYNLSKKSIWLNEKLPFIKDYILLRNDGCVMDKSIVEMSGNGNIFMDDVESNLRSSNCDNKVLFGKRFEWNKKWDGDWCLDWSDVEERYL